jgi:hypothetical protein
MDQLRAAMSTSNTWWQRNLGDWLAGRPAGKSRAWRLPLNFALVALGTAVLVWLPVPSVGVFAILPVCGLAMWGGLCAIDRSGWVASPRPQRIHSTKESHQEAPRFVGIWPAGKEAWFRLALLPFKVFVLAVPFWLQVWKWNMRAIPDFYSWYHTEKYYFGDSYIFCFKLFILAAMLQWLFGWRRSAWVSLIFSAVTIAIYGLCLDVSHDSK